MECFYLRLMQFPKPSFYAEVQFQKDEDFYHRFFSELFLFLYRHSIRYDDWFGVIIFGSGSLEPSNSNIHRALLESGQVRRVYLDELGDLREQPLGLGLMLLTNVTSETEADEGARFLLEQARQQSEQAIIDLVTTIIVYKFSTLSREEIQAMLGLNLEESRAIREAEEVGERKGLVKAPRTNPSRTYFGSYRSILGNRARYLGWRQNLFDSRCVAAVHNLHVIARMQNVTSNQQAC